MTMVVQYRNKLLTSETIWAMIVVNLFPWRDQANAGYYEATDLSIFSHVLILLFSG